MLQDAAVAIARRWKDNENLNEESSTSSKPPDFTSNLMVG
jgi:hypothetical protein